MNTTKPIELTPMLLPPLNPEPPVTIILANYNYARFLPDAVHSVLRQTYSNWELIICDDGSTDDSVEIAREFACHDSRICVLVKDNGGQVSAWNLAYQHCRGDIICFLDSDDAFAPGKVERIVQQLQKHPYAGLAYHQFQYVDEQLKPLDQFGPLDLPTGWLPDLALRCGQAFASKTSDFAVRREVMDLLVPLPEELPFADGYICRIATFLTEIAAIPDVLSYYRIHGSNAMGNVTLLNQRTLAPLVALIHSSFEREQGFLCEHLGPSLVEQRRLDGLVHLWRAMGALYLLEGKPREGIEGYSADQILSILKEQSQRYIWTLLFTLPAPVSRRLLHLWWSESAWKPLVRPIAGFLGLREKPDRIFDATTDATA